MKKKVPVSSQHRWRWRLGLPFFLLLLVLFLFKLELILLIMPQYTFNNSQLQAPPLPFKPKIAFLFLVRNRMPLEFVWHRYFQGANENLFSIYIHSRPGFVYNRRTTKSKYFYNRQLPNSILVDWGEASMIQAERLLLTEALKDVDNERFVLLSDSCIPMYNFTYMYDYIMSSPKSFVDSFLDNKEHRYNPKMSPAISVDRWRKGSQWFVLLRTHAELVASDQTIFPLFQEHCKRRPLPEFWRQENIVGDPSKQHNCIPDEHYVQTLLAIHGVEEELERRTLTYTLWNASNRNLERKGWHPVTFAYSEATPKLIEDIKAILSVYYETEYRTEWCNSNGMPRPCFLFARKFTRGAALRLFNEISWPHLMCLFLGCS